jgi:hypothetical protein
VAVPQRKSRGKSNFCIYYFLILHDKAIGNPGKPSGLAGASPVSKIIFLKQPHNSF